MAALNMGVLLILAINLAIVSIILHKIRKKFSIVDRFCHAYSGSLCIILLALFIEGILAFAAGNTLRTKGVPGMAIGVAGIYFCFVHWSKTMLGSPEEKVGRVYGWYLTSVLSGLIVGLTVFNSADRFKNASELGSIFLLAVLVHLIVFHISYKTSIAIKTSGSFEFFSPVKLALPIFFSFAALIYTVVK